MAPPKNSRQQTLEATLGRPRVKTVVKPKRNAQANAKPRQQSQLNPPRPQRKQQVVLDDSSSESAVEEGFTDGDDLDRPSLPGKRNPRSRRKSDSSAASGRSQTLLSLQPRPIVVDDDSDEKPLAPPSSSRKKVQKRPIVIDDSDEEDIVLPVKRRRLVRRGSTSAGESDNEPIGKEPQITLPSRAGQPDDLYTLMKRGKRKSVSHSTRTPKRKQLELLRRRRAGEVIEEKDLSSSEDEERKPAYDSDSDNLALSNFEDEDDDDEPEPELPEMEMQSKKGKEKAVSRDRKGHHSENDENLDDFIVEDDDGPLGVPQELLDIPLEFTSHAHKSMKEHFRDAIEWLVLLKINPGFAEKKHSLYMLSWRKLDDEVRGLAESKFASSAWKADFFMTLRARPAITAIELPKSDIHDAETCMACGRRNHPARWVISFQGSAYHKNIGNAQFLEDVEYATSSGSDEADEGGSRSYDEDGNRIAEEDKRWFVGSVCCSNAETAHVLMHWKHQLLEWVDTNLEADGYLRADKRKERKRMKLEERYELVDKIMLTWTNCGLLKRLYREFKKNLEAARNKSTTGRSTYGRK